MIVPITSTVLTESEKKNWGGNLNPHPSEKGLVSGSIPFVVCFSLETVLRLPHTSLFLDSTVCFHYSISRTHLRSSSTCLWFSLTIVLCCQTRAPSYVPRCPLTYSFGLRFQRYQSFLKRPPLLSNQ